MPLKHWEVVKLLHKAYDVPSLKKIYGIVSSEETFAALEKFVEEKLEDKEFENKKKIRQILDGWSEFARQNNLNLPKGFKFFIDGNNINIGKRKNILILAAGLCLKADPIPDL